MMLATEHDTVELNFVQPCYHVQPIAQSLPVLGLGCVLQLACVEGGSKGSRDKHAWAGVWKCLGLT